MAKSTVRKSQPRSAKLGDVVAEKQPLLHPNESLKEAGDKMRDEGAEALPVTEGRRLVGVVDQTNPDRRAAGFGHDPRTTSVSDIMSSDVAYCLESDDCAGALRRMNDRNLDRLPVVDREMRIVGIVTRADLMERASESQTS